MSCKNNRSLLKLLRSVTRRSCCADSVSPLAWHLLLPNFLFLLLIFVLFCLFFANKTLFLRVSNGDVSFSLGLELYRVIFYAHTCQRMASYVGALHLPLENSG